MREESSDILIIGAGASALACAAELAPIAKKQNKKILILEAQKVCARKILISGNGRCNFTNIAAAPDKYYGDKNFITEILKQFPPTECLKFFDKLGLKYINENGRYFPIAGKASAVKECFLNWLENYGVQILEGQTATQIKRNKNLWEVKTQDSIFKTKFLVLACGSKAYPQISGTDLGYTLARQAGHKIKTPAPALFGFDLQEKKALIRIAGIKMQARVWLENYPKNQQTDEITFTSRGVNGNNILTLSRNAKPGSKLFIDFLPQFTDIELTKYLQDRAKQFPNLKTKALLSGILPDSLINLLIDFAHLRKNNRLIDLTPSNFAKIKEKLEAWPFTVAGIRPFEEAYSATGGVLTSEVNAATLRSKCANNLFIIGELLDIDAFCGGYSLHFAFATGISAAKNIGDNLC
ncbi:MAG: aminoacetone oxidase family FAD-binding enzyme [Elusimicrobiaceae bacterium]|nr:aminoacetone oxidase family FAD-binding enzyme [Elusimicrobiaceae bacterium]